LTSRTRRWCGALLGLPLLCLGASCTDRAPAVPQILEVTPSSGSNAVTTPISIFGTFHPLLQANYDEEEQAQVSTRFVAVLGAKALVQISFISSNKLSATVPAGMAPGVYDLTVTDPRGRKASLLGAFTVTLPGLDLGPDLPRDAGPEGPLPDLPVVDAPTDAPPDLPVIKPDSKPDVYTGPTVSTLAGSGVKGFKDGASTAAQLFNPVGVVAFGGTVYVGDFGNQRIRAVVAGAVSTFAGTGVQGKLNGAAASAQFNFPAGLALSADGKTLYVADSANDMIRKIVGGTVSTLAGSGIKGLQNGAAGSARFNYPRGIAVDGAKVYVADTENHCIRMISGGVVSTVAGSGTPGFLNGAAASARFNAPHGVFVVSSKIYVADSDNHRVRVISGGTVSTLAGQSTSGNVDGPVASATFGTPVDLVVSGSKVYVVDQSNHRIRLIDSGVVSTVAGSYLGYKDGPVTSARFHYPHGIAFGGAKQLIITDQSNHRIRLISL
jgi:hypothetical protein